MLFSKLPFCETRNNILQQKKMQSSPCATNFQSFNQTSHLGSSIPLTCLQMLGFIGGFDLASTQQKNSLERSFYNKIQPEVRYFWVKSKHNEDLLYEYKSEKLSFKKRMIAMIRIQNQCMVLVQKKLCLCFSKSPKKHGANWDFQGFPAAAASVPNLPPGHLHAPETPKKHTLPEINI